MNLKIIIGFAIFIGITASGFINARGAPDSFVRVWAALAGFGFGISFCLVLDGIFND